MNEEVNQLLDTAAIARYHRDMIQKHGSGATGALGWLQHEGQQARFGMLSRIADLNGCSVLDAGCGHADLFPFLRSLYPAITYYGCEQLPDLLNVAAHRYRGEPNITLLLADFLQSPLPATDYVLACGSLNYRHHNESFIYAAIETLFARCRKGLGFNLLSGGVEPGILLVAYDPEEIVRFCRTLTPHTELYEGYWKDDFTVFLYKLGKEKQENGI